MASLINALSTAVSPYVMPVVEKNVAPDFLVRFGELKNWCVPLVSSAVYSSVQQFMYPGAGQQLIVSLQSTADAVFRPALYVPGVRRQCGHRLQEIARGTSVEQVCRSEETPNVMTVLACGRDPVSTTRSTAAADVVSADGVMSADY